MAKEGTPVPVAPSDEPELLQAEWQGDPLSRFPAEAQVAAAARSKKRRWTVAAIAAPVLLLLLAAAAWFAPRIPGLWPAARAQGSLTIESSPPGARVEEAGRDLGVTPLTLSLPVGSHSILLRRGGAVRELTVEVRPGTLVVHHVELSEAPRTGSLRVDTLPPGATVEVDGAARGTAPVDIIGLEPGDHQVTVTSGAATVTEKVAIVAGGAASLVVPLARPEAGSSAGWVTVVAPIELQLYEGDSLVGSSRMSRVMLPAGLRTLRMVNTDTGFEATSRVEVQAGSVTRLPVKMPNGQLSVNAVPWAEVFLDGRRIGETPISNYATPLGPHEIVLRHPRYAEQRRSVVVSLSAPARLGVDLRQ